MASPVFDYTFHLNYLHDLLTKAEALDKRIESAFSFLCQLLNADEVYFNTFNANLSHAKETFVCTKFGFVGSPYQSIPYKSHKKVIQVLSEQQYYYVKEIDQETDKDIHHRFKERGIRGFWFYPIEVKETLIGCLGVRNYSKPLYIDHAHLMLIRFVSRLIAQIVEKEYSFFKYMINENLYKYFFQAFPFPFVILNEDYKIIDVNSAFEQLFDILTYEIIFRDFFQVLNNYDNERIKAQLEALEPYRPSTYEIFKVINQENKILKLLMVRLDDEHTHYYGVCIEDITEIKVNERTLHKLAYHDPLSGLHNRNYFEKVCLELETEPNQSLGIISIKLDNLKEVNLQFGYEEGDRLIYSVAEAITATMGAERLIARISGGEFIVFIVNKDKHYIEKKQDDFQQRLDAIKAHLKAPVKLSMMMAYAENSWEIGRLLDEVGYNKKRLRRKQRQLVATHQDA